jgi:hypothetical protein
MKVEIDNNALEKKVDDFTGKCEGELFLSLSLDRNHFSQLRYYPAAFLDRQIVLTRLCIDKLHQQKVIANGTVPQVEPLTR